MNVQKIPLLYLLFGWFICIPLKGNGQSMMDSREYVVRHYQVSAGELNRMKSDISVLEKHKPLYEKYLRFKSDGAFSQALPLVDTLARKHSEESWERYVFIIEQKAHLLTKMGRFTEAEDILYRVINIMDKHLNFGQHPFYTTVYQSLSALKYRRGEYAMALDYATQALEIEQYMAPDEANQLLMATDAGLDHLHNLMGICKLRLDEPLKAKFHFVDAAKENEKYFGDGNEIFRNKIYNHKALARYMANQPDSAKTLVNRALNNSNESEYPIFLINKGLLLLGTGKTEEAAAVLKQALQSKRIKKNQILNSKLHTHIAFIKLQGGEHSSAAQHLEEAIRLNTGKELPLKEAHLKETANSILLLEQIRLSMEIQPHNRHRYRLADVLIGYLRNNYAQDADKIRLSSFVAEIYRIIIRDYYNGFVNRNESPDSLYYYIEQNKGSQLMQALASADAVELAGIPDSLVQRDQKLREEITRLEQALATSEASDFDIKTRLFEKKKTHRRLIARLELKYPDYHELKYADNSLSLEEFRAFLPDSVQVLSQTLLDDEILWLSITSDSTEALLVSDRYNLENSAREFRQSINEFEKNGYASNAFRIYKRMIEPVLDNRKSQIVIIPEGIFTIIPFEALLTRPARKKEYAEMDFLVKQYSVSYSYSSRLFYRTARKEKARPEMSKLQEWTAFAPVFDDKNRPGAPDERDRSAWKELGLRDRQSFAPLPGTESEISVIGNLLEQQNWDVSVLLRNRASEHALKNLNVADNSIVHLATHGFSHANNPAASGLACSVVNKSQGDKNKEDGILYSREMYNLSWNAGLVVLSACETGLGKITDGEGILGLTRALLHAGTRNMIVSLWQVSDAGTSKLMQAFYQRIAESDKDLRYYASHFREAKLSMIRREKFSNPFYWSAFVLIGR